MMPARKNEWFNFVLRRWLSWTLRRRFHNIRVAGREHLRELTAGSPVVGCVNHTNWWDGFVLYVLSYRLLPHEIYLAMEENNLRYYPFFAWMGVFGLDAASPQRTLRGIRYAIRLLRTVPSVDGRPPLIWMFVQGRLLPPGTPIEVKPGALLLARQSGAAILPLVLRYEWLSESRPTILVRVGRPLPATVSTSEMAETLNELFASVPAATDATGLSEYEPLFARQMSLNKWWELLTRFVRPSQEPFEGENR